MSDIYQRIKMRREELGLSQEALAKRMGYKSKSSINKIEMGINDIPQSKVLAFARALNTTTAYLMGDDDSREANPIPPGFEPIPQMQKIPHEIAIFRLFRAVFVLLEILQNTLKYRNISQKCKSICKSN